jgi:hypothetical protein
MSDAEYKTFSPCVRGAHGDCTGAFFADGHHWVCDCACHRQGSFFPPRRKQGAFNFKTLLSVWPNNQVWLALQKMFAGAAAKASC